MMLFCENAYFLDTPSHSCSCFHCHTVCVMPVLWTLFVSVCLSVSLPLYLCLYLSITISISIYLLHIYIVIYASLRLDSIIFLLKLRQPEIYMQYDYAYACMC